jgi:hypothetical protein
MKLAEDKDVDAPVVEPVLAAEKVTRDRVHMAFAIALLPSQARRAELKRIYADDDFAPEFRTSTTRATRLALVFQWLLVVWVLLALPTAAGAVGWRTKLLHRLVAPLRSDPFRESRTTPCSLGFASCFLPDAAPSLPPRTSEFAPAPIIENPSQVVTLQLRALHRGPFSHHWLEVESSRGEVTFGFGPATLPFIDAGQISLQDRFGNIERISGMYPLPILGPPPLNYRYAKAPGTGHPIGQPIQLTVAQADALVEKVRHHKFIGPYIPIFHDCRTFACSVQAAAQGRSSLPCYLLFKGYW